MTITTIPFERDEIESSQTIRAIIETARGDKGSGFNGPHAGAYGIVAWGRGEIVRMWGAGYAPSEDILRAHAVARLLDRTPEGIRLVIHAKGLADQLRHVSRSAGYTASGKPFSGYDVFKSVQKAQMAGRWTLLPFKARMEPRGHDIAAQLAGDGLREVLRLRPLLQELAEDAAEHAILLTNEGHAPEVEGIGLPV